MIAVEQAKEVKDQLSVSLAVSRCDRLFLSQALRCAPCTKKDTGCLKPVGIFYSINTALPNANIGSDRAYQLK